MSFQGTFVTFGFFGIANGYRFAVTKPSQQNASGNSTTYFMRYTTSIQCSDGSGMLPAELRIYSPPHDSPIPDNTVVFAVAKVHVQDSGPVLLDAINGLYPVPGDPDADGYEDSVPNMPYPYMYGIGTSQGKHELLADGKSRGFNVRVSERVRDGQTLTVVQNVTSTVQYVACTTTLISILMLYAQLCPRRLSSLDPRSCPVSTYLTSLSRPVCLRSRRWDTVAQS